MFPFYAAKLLVPGWAGEYTSVERAYVCTHRSDARNRKATAAGARLQRARSTPATPYTDAA